MNDNGEYYNEAQIRERFTEQELLNDVLSRIKNKPWVDAMIETGTMKEDKDGVIRFTSKAIKKHDCLKDITVSREELE